MRFIYLTFAIGILTNKIVEKSIKGWLTLEQSNNYLKAINKTYSTIPDNNLIFKLKIIKIED
jgi:hypothetical protein